MVSTRVESVAQNVRQNVGEAAVLAGEMSCVIRMQSSEGGKFCCPSCMFAQCDVAQDQVGADSREVQICVRIAQHLERRFIGRRPEGRNQRRPKFACQLKIAALPRVRSQPIDGIVTD